MSLQSLAVIFTIIILPISLLLNVYVGSQVETLRLQISYDNKLNNSTYDALKAFQLNTINNSTSDIPDSKISDIKASVNTFYDSIASNFNMNGYNRDILKTYVPALVYTMYDGYYIYSEYTNTIEDDDYLSPEELEELDIPDSEPKPEVSSYQKGDQVSGIKSYVYYSCRYKSEGKFDIVITYSLDNYITIKGVIYKNNQLVPINDAGYLIDNIDINGNENDIINLKVKYKGIAINNEDFNSSIEKILGEDGNERYYKYHKINGVKYYYDEDTGKWFSILDGVRKGTSDKFSTLLDTSAKKYYYNAYKFRQRLQEYGLDSLNTKDAYEIEGGEEVKLATKNNWRRI